MKMSPIGYCPCIQLLSSLISLLVTCLHNWLPSRWPNMYLHQLLSDSRCLSGCAHRRYRKIGHRRGVCPITRDTQRRLALSTTSQFTRTTRNTRQPKLSFRHISSNATFQIHIQFPPSMQNCTMSLIALPIDLVQLYTGAETIHAFPTLCLKWY